MIYRTKKELIAAITLGLICTFNSYAKKSSKLEFQQAQMKSPFNISQAITVADILPYPGKELITFSVDEQGNRLLILYKLATDKSRYEIAEQTIMPEHYYRFDVTKLEDKLSNKTSEEKLSEAPQQLYFLATNELALYQSNKSNKFKSLAKIKSLYVHESVDYLSRGNFIQDLNNDSFDDVIIADFDKTHILIGQGLNRFSKQTLPIQPVSRIFSNGATYTETPLYFNDINFDGKTDILTAGEGEMLAYPQSSQSQFSHKPIDISINDTISSINWWDKRDDNGEKLDQSKLSFRKLEELRDINADDIPDLIVRFTKTSGVLDRVNDYEVYLGKQAENQVVYPQQASTVIHAEGTLTGLVFDDINNDNKLEVLLSGFDIGLSQIIGALVTGSIDQDVYLFQMDSEDNFSDKPAIKKGVELTFSLSSGQTGSAVVKLADLNGDGLKDLVLSVDDDELKVYLGKVPGKNNKAFRKRSVSYDTKLPQDGANVQVHDLNGDGKDDLLMQFARLDGEDKAKAFTVLFAQ